MPPFHLVRRDRAIAAPWCERRVRRTRLDRSRENVVRLEYPAEQVRPLGKGGDDQPLGVVPVDRFSPSRNTDPSGPVGHRSVVLSVARLAIRLLSLRPDEPPSNSSGARSQGCFRSNPRGPAAVSRTARIGAIWPFAMRVSTSAVEAPDLTPEAHQRRGDAAEAPRSSARSPSRGNNRPKIATAGALHTRQKSRRGQRPAGGSNVFCASRGTDPFPRLQQFAKWLSACP